MYALCTTVDICAQLAYNIYAQYVSLNLSSTYISSQDTAVITRNVATALNEYARSTQDSSWAMGVLSVHTHIVQHDGLSK